MVVVVLLGVVCISERAYINDEQLSKSENLMIKVSVCLMMRSD